MQASATRELGRDIRALESHLSQLRTIRQEIDTKRHVIVMGPGSDGINALDALGAGDELGALIESYEMAIGQLSDEHTLAEISESTARMFTANGSVRTNERRYLRDLIAGYRDDCGTYGNRRAA
jgi:hypothetical protein